MNGFVSYKNGRKHVNHTIASQWVVPYNIDLLEAFDCRLNIKICSSVKSIQYIIMYELKGKGKAIFKVEEIDKNHNVRYVRPC